MAPKSQSSWVTIAREGPTDRGLGLPIASEPPCPCRQQCDPTCWLPCRAKTGPSVQPCPRSMVVQHRPQHPAVPSGHAAHVGANTALQAFARTSHRPFNLGYPITVYDTHTRPWPLWPVLVPIAPRSASHVRSVFRPHRRMSPPVSHQHRSYTYTQSRSPCWSPVAPLLPPVQWGRRVPPRTPLETPPR